MKDFKIKVILKIKNIFGLCSCDGCMKKSEFEIEIPAINTKRYLCEEHVKTLTNELKGTKTNIKYEDLEDEIYE